MTIRYNEAEVAQYLARFNHGKAKVQTGAALSPADLESDIVAAVTKKDQPQDVRPRYRIHVCSKRKRLTDPDAVCAKWLIDGLVKGKVIPDDSAKSVDEVSYSQEKSDAEETIVEVWEIDA